MKHLLKVLGFLFMIGFLLPEPVVAQTPDGQTPATESVCNEAALGGALKGLCNAYCEALDCDGNPSASVVACEAVRGKFLSKAGGLEPPCLIPPTIDHCAE